jgi:hypothetical protein
MLLQVLLTRTGIDYGRTRQATSSIIFELLRL